MIDVLNEELIALTDVADHLPRRGGRKVNYSTIFRWVQRGIRGKRLETVRMGGCRFTSKAALNRFFAEPHCDAYPESGAARQRAIAEAQAICDAEGL